MSRKKQEATTVSKKKTTSTSMSKKPVVEASIEKKDKPRKFVSKLVHVSSTSSSSEESSESETVEPVQVVQNTLGYTLSNGKTQVNISKFEGNWRVDVRNYFYNQSTGIMCPTKKGINLSVSEWKSLLENASFVESFLKSKGAW